MKFLIEIYYIDDGEKNDIPVVFISGLGTSVRAIRLLDFLRSFREELGLRLISIERNGFGQTQYNPSSYIAQVDIYYHDPNLQNSTLDHPYHCKSIFCLFCI